MASSSRRSKPVQDILLPHKGIVRYIIHLDDGTFVSCGNDKLILRWSITGDLLKTFQQKQHRRWVTCAVQLNETTVVTGSDDNKLKVWDLNSSCCKQTITTHNSEFWCLWLNHNKTKLFCGKSNGVIEVRCVSDLQKVHTVLSGHSGPVMSLCELQEENKRVLVSGSRDCSLKVWDLLGTQIECTKTLVGHENWVYKVMALRDGKTVVSGSMDYSVKLWDVVSGACYCTLHKHKGFVYCILELSDGHIVTGSRDMSFKVWSRQTHDPNKQLQQLPPPPPPSEENTMVCVASYKVNFFVYHLEELEDGKLLVGGGDLKGSKIQIYQLWNSLVYLCCLEIVTKLDKEDIRSLMLPTELCESCLRLKDCLKKD